MVESKPSNDSFRGMIRQVAAAASAASAVSYVARFRECAFPDIFRAHHESPPKNRSTHMPIGSVCWDTPHGYRIRPHSYPGLAARREKEERLEVDFASTPCTIRMVVKVT